MQEKPIKANACWAVWVATGIFLVATELFSAGIRSRQELSWS